MPRNNKRKIKKKKNNYYPEEIKNNKKTENKSQEKNNNRNNNINNNLNNNIYKPKGLVNLGLSCYMNSIVQCFFHIIKLRDFFISNENNFDDKEQPISNALSELMYELKNGNVKNVKPTKLRKVIADKNPLFSENKAGDAKDLYFNLIDGLLDELSDGISKEPSNSGELNLSDKIEVYKETKKEIDYNNIINKIFIGIYESIYICKKKKKYIYAFQVESFILFDLENIKKHYDKEHLSLDLCFDYYIKDHEKSSFYCNLCDETHEGKSINGIYESPEILTIILDRGHGKTFKGQVDFEQKINIKKYVDKEYNKDKNDILYKLICICTHSGESSSKGHYTSYCLNENGKFYYFSDDYVEEVEDEKELYEDEPYLLFYQKLETNNISHNEENNQIKDLSNNLTNNDENDNNNENNINEENENSNEKNGNNNEKDINNNAKIKKIGNKTLYDLKNARKKYKNKNKTKEEDKKENNLEQNENEKENLKINQKEEEKSTKFTDKNEEKEKEIKNIENNNINDLEIKINEYLNKTNMKNIKIENIGIENQKILIKEILNLLIEEKNPKYIINYYLEEQKDPLIWKLIIKGPKESFYKDIDIHFKIDFHNLEFENLTISTYNETKIYHLNFYNDLEEIPFEYKYNSNFSFYQNINNYFDFLYELLINPKTDICEDKEKLKIYNQYPDKYKKLASKKYEYVD